jgi:hypothetical protein
MCDNHNQIWDQRIPNEPILNRNFLLIPPPMPLDPRPVSTYGTQARPVGMNGNINGVDNTLGHLINTDIAVKPYRPLRSKDCIPTESIAVLEHQRLHTDAMAREHMRVAAFLAPGPVWDQNTSRKLQTPHK